MATLVLQTAGAAIGGFLGGPVGALIGRAAGAIGGAYVDQQLFGPGDRSIIGPRLETAKIQNSREGAPISRVFGRARLSGQIIWATRFLEVQTSETESQGGKGGGPKTTTTTFSYFANFAIGICEGPTAGIRRIWADGKLIDQTQLTIRSFNGDEEQSPDSLIEAKQTAGNTPAYRGLAYVVFENFPLEDYGNRIPQISVEVVRPVGQLEQYVRAVNIIPGATESGYDTVPVVEQIDAVSVRKLNVHQTLAQTDFIASLDDLIATCPNLEQIALVVAWFGDDLRAGECTIRPKVETASRNLQNADQSQDWQVAGLGRNEALLVSRSGESAAFGGTPSDQSVVRAIQEIRARGLRVCLNPFIMMDIPSDNELPSPYGGSSQPVYPWRGRITCNPARGIPGSVDGTPQAASQVASFLGSASPNDVVIDGGIVSHSALSEWSFRRMMLHYARLAELAGGVEMFIIGSEMRGLTSVQDESGFPFVDGLISLAQDIRAIVGPNCRLTYGADWSEYFGFQPNDGSNDVFYNLDPLWSHSAIDAIGIDAYMPASDWRPGGDPQGVGRASADPQMMQAQVAAGEGYDWYYLSDADRQSGTRTPITDGLGKPWVFRYKDLLSWWSNPHFERIDGVEKSTSTSWQAQSKPIVFTELGCPAINNGAVQPNVFFDAKSSESFVPYFSNGGRDDQVQATYIETHQAHWDPQHPRFKSSQNPVSDVFGAPMVDMSACQLWAWDARPYPEFPGRSDIWSDAENWHTGHWLNGRLGSVRLADMIGHLLKSSGIDLFDVTQVYGVLTGYVVGTSGSVRDEIEVLINLYRLSVWEAEGRLHFASPGSDEPVVIAQDALVFANNRPVLSVQREQENELPTAAHLQFIDADDDYRDTEAQVRRINRTGLEEQTLAAPLVTTREVVEPVLEAWLHARWLGRETITFGLDRSAIRLNVGDNIVFENAPQAQNWRIVSIEEGEHLQMVAQAVEPGEVVPIERRPQSRALRRLDTGAPPLVKFLDLPILGADGTKESNVIAVASRPWPGPMAVYASPSDDGFALRQTIPNTASIGELNAPLAPSDVVGRWCYAQTLEVRLHTGALSSSQATRVLNGSNALAVKTPLGSWEVLQFQVADLIDDRTWRLNRILRGQAGTEVEARAGADAGADVVVLNGAVFPLEGVSSQRGLELNWLIGPTGTVLGGPEFTRDVFATGYRGLTPYSPVHLDAWLAQSGGLEIRWIRRDRINADDWTPVEIAMSEASENYEVNIADNQANTLVLQTPTTGLSIDAAELHAVFGINPVGLNVFVRQLSATVGTGPAATAFVSSN